MLTLTQNATLIVKEIADQQGGAEGTGLRITAGVVEHTARTLAALEETLASRAN